MADRSAIEWTESTWNPITGCTKVSPGCKHCYAERMALRLQAMGQPNYADGFALTLHEHVLELPLQWKTPKTIFVNSMSDLSMSWGALTGINFRFSPSEPNGYLNLTVDSSGLPISGWESASRIRGTCIELTTCDTLAPQSSSFRSNRSWDPCPILISLALTG